MPKSFTHCWSQSTLAQEPTGGETLDNTAGNCFVRAGVTKGDRIFAVSFNYGSPILIGRLVAGGPPCSKQHAARKLSTTTSSLWEAKEHIIAEKGTASEIKYREIPFKILKALRFHSPTGTKGLKFSASNRPDQQTLRGVRRLTEDSADLLDGMLTLRPRQKKYSKEPTPSRIEPSYVEGALSSKKSAYYERNPKARRACVEKHGWACLICGFNFIERYGKIGEGFIEVHHRRPISDCGGEYIVDPVRDLIPVCPNCHAMLHRGNPPPKVKQLQSICRKRLKLGL